MQQPNPTVNHKTSGREQAEPIRTFEFEKKIGATNYKVCVHFHQTSGETYEDKLLRLMKSEVSSRE